MERMRQREWDREAGRRWLVVAAVCGGLFLLLTWAVLAIQAVSNADLDVTRWLAEHRVGWVTGVMKAFTALGSWPTLLVISLAVGGWFLWRSRDWRPGVDLLAALLGAIVLYRVVKAILDRPRPPVGFRAVGVVVGSAYPSGHATQATAVLAVLALLLMSNRGRRGGLAIGWAAGLAIFLIGASRVYLGVHWTTDVVAGWALGLFWMATLVVGAGRGAFRPRGAPLRSGWYRPVRGP
jgi:undecaprenyl-diphosphatase